MTSFSICQQTGCTKCCQHTNMLLSQEDIAHITDLGYNENDFCFQDNDGWIRLKNTDKFCFFHTGESCSIYKHRPKGCQLYPIVYDLEKKEAFHDKECPQPTFFPISKESKHQLFTLIDTLQKERKRRIEKGSIR